MKRKKPSANEVRKRRFRAAGPKYQDQGEKIGEALKEGLVNFYSAWKINDTELTQGDSIIIKKNPHGGTAKVLFCGVEQECYAPRDDEGPGSPKSTRFIVCEESGEAFQTAPTGLVQKCDDEPRKSDAEKGLLAFIDALHASKQLVKERKKAGTGKRKKKRSEPAYDIERRVVQPRKSQLHQPPTMTGDVPQYQTPLEASLVRQNEDLAERISELQGALGLAQGALIVLASQHNKAPIPLDILGLTPRKEEK